MVLSGQIPDQREKKEKVVFRELVHHEPHDVSLRLRLRLLRGTPWYFVTPMNRVLLAELMSML